MSLVWDSTVRAPERFTLLALADRADEDGLCWPSIPTLSKKCRTGESTIRRHNKWLESEGLLAIQHRFNDSSIYKINLPALRALVDPGQDDTPSQSDTPSQIDTPSQSGGTPPPDLSGTPSQSEHLSIIDPSVKDVPSAGKPAEPPRDDVEALCSKMLERLTALDIRPLPRVTAKWRQQARLLLDEDRRELQKALRLIDWATRDPFWSQNIHSIPTFRKQYDRLRMAAIADHEKSKGGLRSVPAGSSVREYRSFEEIRDSSDVEFARRLIRTNYLMPDRPMDHELTHGQWERHCAREWITEHEAPIRAALNERMANA